MIGIRRVVSVAVATGLMGMVWTGAGWAEPAWVQIEARPTLPEAEARARDWAADLPGVSGFAMSTGWYAIAIGPYDSLEIAEEQRRILRANQSIPLDSYVSDGRRFRQQFWPQDGQPAPAPQLTAAPETPEPPAPEVAPEAEVAVVAPPAESNEAAPAPETLAESRRLESQLSREDRMAIQSALEWQGFYKSTIDGAFGRGTRASIAAWQQAAGVEATGVLSSTQQAQLLDAVAADRAALGLTEVTEDQAGIAITLPLGLVEFDHYDPPFVHYRAKDGSGVSVLLISEPGDQATLFGLYDAMQTLEIVPMQGARNRDRGSFTIEGANARIRSYTQATLSGGLIKGFTLVWPAEDSAKMERVLATMKSSFKPVGQTALDPTLGQPLGVAKGALMAGLEVRTPEFARTGFFVTEGGAVLTAGAGIETCGRLTIEDHEADLAFADPATGIAVLTPRKPLAPAAVARFATTEPGPGADLALAGFSYPEALSAPVMSFGTLSALSGLAEEPGQARLALRTLPGDVGGPVLDSTGAVMGMLLPVEADSARILPEDLSLAVQAVTLVQVLAETGFAPLAADATGTRAPEDLARAAQDFTVQVACWK